jgi:hypothetical protein
MAHLDNTKSHKMKETTNKLKILEYANYDEQQDHESREVLSKIISNDGGELYGGDGDRVIFEKRYFDILPNDLDSEDVEDDVLSHELVKTSLRDSESAPISLSTSFEQADGSVDNRRRVNRKRFRRDLTSSSKQKRQTYYVQHHQPFPVARSPISSPIYNPYTDFYFPQHLQYINQPFEQILYRRSPSISYETRFDATNNYQPSHYGGQGSSGGGGGYAPSRNPNPYHPSNTNRLHPPGNLYLPPKPTYLPPTGNKGGK